MTITESCACGATFQVRDDSSITARGAATSWRKDHRHEAANEEAEEIDDELRVAVGELREHVGFVADDLPRDHRREGYA